MTSLSQVTDKFYHILLHRTYLAINGFELTTLSVIGTTCTDNYKSAAVPKFAEQRVITALNNRGWIHHLWILWFCCILLNTPFCVVENVGCAKIESWNNKNIDGFYTKTTQKGVFSKIQQNQSIHR
jgi:hypothetical protein